MSTSCTVCVFAKPPRAGAVKTRLASSIGAEPAAGLASAFLRDTWRSVTRLPWARPVLAATEKAGFPPLGGRTAVWLQGEGDLGARLERVLRRALTRGWPAIAIGADSPGMPQRLVEGARLALESADAVLGPADDGGFYLLGMRTCPAGGLDRLPWSTAETFRVTHARLRALGLEVAVLEPWFDVDRPQDLARLIALIGFGGLDAPATTQELASLGLLPAGPRLRTCA